MIASVLHLNRSDVKTLKITDAYSLHRVVYGLYDDIRTASEKQQSVSSGILYADKGGDFNGRRILMLSSRPPNPPEHGELSVKKITDHFLTHPHYHFEVVINPTKRDPHSRKIIALKNREDIANWFINKAPQWGFSASPEHLEVREIRVQQFKKTPDGPQITQGQATLLGRLTVLDHAQFKHHFSLGIGRGHAFGCGLLQIVPIKP